MIEQKQSDTILHSEETLFLDRFTIEFNPNIDKSKCWITVATYMLDSEQPFEETVIKASKQDLLEMQQIINQMIEKI